MTEIIKKERPDGILLAFGGQTALNCGTELYLKGVLKEYGVEVLGTSVEAIMNTEDRDLFVKELNKIDAKVPVSHACENLEDALASARKIGYPVMIRSAYALGGLGSGVCPDEATFKEIAESAFTFAPQVLVEESLKGWKEIEFECIRDANDHCFTVASMENFDPLGIHTGESIVVAPTCSLTDEQVKMLQEITIMCVRHLNIVGECNIQFQRLPHHRDQCTSVAFVCPCLEGYRLSSGIRCRKDCPGLYTRPDRRDGHYQLGLCGSFARLYDLQDPTLGPHEVCGRKPQDRFVDEVGGRNHVHRTFVRGNAAEGSAYDRTGHARLCGQ